MNSIKFPKKIAIVYDHANTMYGGAENVLKALHQAFPNAILHSSVYHPKAKWANKWPKKISFLQSIPGAKLNHRLLAPLMPIAFESFDFSNFNIIISISAGAAKGVLSKPNQQHVCYLLTPTRYLYSHQKEYFSSRQYLRWPIIKQCYKLIKKYLLWWDQTAAFRPDHIIPISQLVKSRIENTYLRNTNAPIYPPINTNELKLTVEKKKIPLNIQHFLAKYPDFFLSVSRLVSYKEISKSIRACQINGLPLIIVGEGPHKKELHKLQSDKILFLGNQPRMIVNYLMGKMKALIMPQIEDFGITALEAAYFGKPSLLSSKSGVTELLAGQTLSVAISKISVKTISEGLKKIQLTEFDSKKLRKIAEKYDKNIFIRKFKKMVDLSTEFNKKDNL